jgi:hypothetical protein
MKTYIKTFTSDSEFRLIQRLDRLESSLNKVKQSLFKFGIGLAFILVVSEGLLYGFFHT